MKKRIKGILSTALVGTIGLVAFAAHADTGSAYFTIEYLEAGMAPEDGMTLKPLNYNIPNPHACLLANGFVLPNPSRTATEKAAMDKLITGAFLAGKQIVLIIDSSRCSGTGTAGFPVYNYVTLHNSQ